MPKTITIDKVEIHRLVLLKDANGDLQLHAEYALQAGPQTVQTKLEPVHGKLTGARRAAALTLFEAVTNDLKTIELG